MTGLSSDIVWNQIGRTKQKQKIVSYSSLYAEIMTVADEDVRGNYFNLSFKSVLTDLHLRPELFVNARALVGTIATQY